MSSAIQNPSVSAGNAVTTWNIDPIHSAAEFKVKHMMIASIKGRFCGVTGAPPGASVLLAPRGCNMLRGHPAPRVPRGHPAARGHPYPAGGTPAPRGGIH